MLFMCFWVIPCGEKNTSTKSPQRSRGNPFVYVFFSSVSFFVAPNLSVIMPSRHQALMAPSFSIHAIRMAGTLSNLSGRAPAHCLQTFSWTVSNTPWAEGTLSVLNYLRFPIRDGRCICKKEWRFQWSDVYCCTAAESKHRPKALFIYFQCSPHPEYFPFLSSLAKAAFQVICHSPTLRDDSRTFRKKQKSGQSLNQSGGAQKTLLTAPNLKARKAASVSWPPFPLYARAFFPVVRHFLWRIPTEQALYFKNLGLVLRAGVWHSTSVVQALPWG